MKKITEKWLELINEELRKQDVPHKQRPWRALMEWSKYSGQSIAFNDANAKETFNWFSKNTKEGSQAIGSLFMGAIYYDSCFWPIFVPITFGEAWLDPFSCLETMPDKIKASLISDQIRNQEFISVCLDSVDYGFGIEEAIESVGSVVFGRELLKSGDQQLRATVTLLLEDKPNAKALESARMATEMFLKALLAIKDGLTEKDAISKLSHDLTKALERCLQVNGGSELSLIRNTLEIFPKIAERYKGADKSSRELWQAYGLAQFTATTVVRTLTDRDSRKELVLS